MKYMQQPFLLWHHRPEGQKNPHQTNALEQDHARNRLDRWQERYALFSLSLTIGCCISTEYIVEDWKISLVSQLEMFLAEEGRGGG